MLIKRPRVQTPSQVKNDWNWSDQFMPVIRSIVGPHLLEPASLEIDRTRAADLVVLRAKNLMIACRVRRPVRSAEYLNQFTLRSRRDSGARTELDKIIDGWGDWMFYGFAASDTGAALERWYLIDLHSFRSHLIRNPSQLKTGEQRNGDGTCFRWFDFQSFPQSPAILISSNLTERMAS